MQEKISLTPVKPYLEVAFAMNLRGNQIVYTTLCGSIHTNDPTLDHDYVSFDTFSVHYCGNTMTVYMDDSEASSLTFPGNRATLNSIAAFLQRHNRGSDSDSDSDTSDDSGDPT
jgi:hypothetical protein